MYKLGKMESYFSTSGQATLERSNKKCTQNQCHMLVFHQEKKRKNINKTKQK